MSGRYRTIVVDPPWPYRSFAGYQGTKGTDNWRRVENDLPYASMTVPEIKSVPVASWAAVDARLFLWATSRFLPIAFEVLSEWGFDYRQTLVWHKTGRPFPFGGSVAPNHAEFLLVAVHGQPNVIGHWQSSVVSVRRPHKHSAKPDAFYDLVEQVSPGPYAELFARRARFGWDYPIGDQALGGVAA